MVRFGTTKAGRSPGDPAGSADGVGQETETLLAVARDPASGKLAMWRVVLRLSPDREAGRALASNPGCPRTLMWCLARWGKWDVASAVAANAHCPARLQNYLAKSPHWAVRASVASNPVTDRRVLRILSHSYLSPELVLMALATNPSIETGIVDQLLAHKSPYVRGVAAAHPAASPSALAELAEGLREPGWILRAIGANPVCPAELSDQLLTWLALGGAVNSDPSFDPVACTGHPGDTRFTAGSWYAEQGRDMWAYKHPLWRVRAVVSGTNGRIPIDHVQLLSRDPNAQVRGLVTRLNGVPITCMIELARDADPTVANRAAARVKASPRAVRRVRLRLGLRLSPALAFAALAILSLSEQVGPGFFTATHHNSGSVHQQCGKAAGGYSFLNGLPGGGSLQCGNGLADHTHFLYVMAGNLGLTVTLPSGVAVLGGAPVLAPVKVQPGQTAEMTLNTSASSVRVTIASTQGVSSVVKLSFPSGNR